MTSVNWKYQTKNYKEYAWKASQTFVDTSPRNKIFKKAKNKINKQMINQIVHLSYLLYQFWPRSLRGVLDTTVCDKVCQWLPTDGLFSPDTPVSSINKADRHDIAEILLKVELTTLNQTKPISILKINTRKIIRYQQPLIEEGQTIQLSKEKDTRTNNDLHNTTQNTKDRETRTPHKNPGWIQVFRKG